MYCTTCGFSVISDEKEEGRRNEEKGARDGGRMNRGKGERDGGREMKKIDIFKTIGKFFYNRIAKDFCLFNRFVSLCYAWFSERCSHTFSTGGHFDPAPISTLKILLCFHICSNLG